MVPGDDVDPYVSFLRPNRSSNWCDGFKSSQLRDGFKSSQRHTGNPIRMICGFCEDSGHHQDGCIKRGPPFWPDWHAKKVKQFNATHGLQPKKSLSYIPTPPPQKSRFEPNLRAIQMMNKF